MRRRLSKTITSTQNFKLKIYPENARYKGSIEDTHILHRKDKTRARLEDPSLFEPDLDKTFPGLVSVPKHILEQSIELCGNQINNRGKTLGISIADEYWWGPWTRRCV